MGSGGQDIDPTGKTLAAATSDAGAAAMTLTRDGGPRAAGSPTQSLVGTHFAHFRIDKPLGRGGMGDVYLATDIALDRPVALKLLREDVAADEKFRERFVREARAQARITHPNVCHIYFIGEQEGRLFFAMEYVEGENLQERLEREGKIHPDEALELCRQAALGLREAQRHGFTHRDVKPSNLLLDRSGVVKVVDFGIVRDQKASPAAVASTLDRGDILGTPLYMAPEQARGEPVDFHADIYSLGATLHHLVAGAPPFAGDTPLAVISKHLSDPRPRLAAQKTRARAGRVDLLCDRMMAKRPTDRVASYDDLVASLEEASGARTRPAGFWVRLFAVILDLLIVAAVAIPFHIVMGELAGEGVWMTLAAAYSIVGHARWGRTVGKWALEVEVVTAEGGARPGLRRAMLRWLVQWGPTAVAAAAAQWLSEASPPRETVALAIVVILVVLMFLVPLGLGIASIFAEGKRSLWDKAAGTRVRYRRSSART
jgi:serine/threonine-protein kinase